MKKIENKGNLPKHLSILAKTLAGKTGADFYECSNAKELEKLAKDKKCELTCTLDPNTDRGFLVGFDVREGGEIIIPGSQIVTLIIYFTELSGSDFKRYSKMLDKHKKSQEDAMFDRRSRLVNSVLEDGG